MGRCWTPPLATPAVDLKPPPPLCVAQDIDEFFDGFQCAALFIDISGFSKITEKLFQAHGLAGAEILAEHLNANLGEICETLTAAGGDIVKFAGDACLCIFAVDNRSLEGAALRDDLREKVLLATRLSLECIAALEAKEYTVMGTTLTAHSGVGVGPVTGFLAGGLFKRSEYTLIGPAISQFGAAEPAAGDGETVVSSQCWELIEDSCVGQVIDGDGEPATRSSALDSWFVRVQRVGQPTAVATAPVGGLSFGSIAKDVVVSQAAAHRWERQSGVFVVADEIERLTREDANAVADEIKQVVPGQVSACAERSVCQVEGGSRGYCSIRSGRSCFLTCASRLLPDSTGPAKIDAVHAGVGA